MGVTVHYRGCIESPANLQAFEDFIVEWVRGHGGEARVWRSRSDDVSGRAVRGVLADIAPGLGAVSFLVSPEAWLLPVTEIERAERSPLPDPPWVFVKTQFAAIEAHITLIDLLSAIKKRFVPLLDVYDEGEYWERRDLDTLNARRALIDEGMSHFEDALGAVEAGPQDATDPSVLVARLEKAADDVHDRLWKPPDSEKLH